MMMPPRRHLRLPFGNDRLSLVATVVLVLLVLAGLLGLLVTAILSPGIHSAVAAIVVTIRRRPPFRIWGVLSG